MNSTYSGKPISGGTHANWKKYRIAIDDYVYDDKGKMIGYLEGGYYKHRTKAGDKFDLIVEKELING